MTRRILPILLLTLAAWLGCGRFVCAQSVANPVFPTNSANLRTRLSDETGTGAAVFATSPTLSAPTIGGTTTVTGALNLEGATGSEDFMWDPVNAVLHLDGSRLPMLSTVNRSTGFFRGLFGYNLRGAPGSDNYKTHLTSGFGYSGVEVNNAGVINFYGATGATTADATVTPVRLFQINPTQLEIPSTMPLAWDGRARLASSAVGTLTLTDISSTSGSGVFTAGAIDVAPVFGLFNYPAAWTGLEPDIYWTSDAAHYRYADSDDFRNQHMVKSTDSAAVGKVTYYVATTGSDAAAGTKAAPLATIAAAQAKTDVLTIMVKAGRYTQSIDPTAKSINIIGYDGHVYLAPGAGLVVTVNATYSNVWEITQSGGFELKRPSSGQFFEEDGVPGLLTRVASIQAVSETPNGYFQSADLKTVYVNSRSSPSIPDDYFVQLFNYQFRIFNNTAACRAYLENLHFIGGIYGVTNATGHKLAAQNCTFTHSEYIQGPVWMSNVSEVYLNNCVIGYSEHDGADYDGAGAWTKFVLESNCKFRSCGLLGAGSLECSSAHDDVSIVRVNNDYEAPANSIGEAVLDVGSGQTINIGNRIRGGPSSSAIGNGSTRQMWSLKTVLGGHTVRFINDSTGLHHVRYGDTLRMPRLGTGPFDFVVDNMPWLWLLVWLPPVKAAKCRQSRSCRRDIPRCFKQSRMPLFQRRVALKPTRNRRRHNYHYHRQKTR